MRTCLSIAAVVSLACAATGDVVAIPARADNTLFDDPSGATSNGSGPVLIVGRAGAQSTAPLRRALLAFDVAAHVPAGATIQSAQLVLVHTSGNGGARTAELHRVLADWGEGASSSASGQGAPAQAGDATWLQRFHPNMPWSAAGGDFDPAASATLAIDLPGPQAFPSTPQMVAEVQAWLDAPATSFGWLVRFSDESTPQTTKVFGSREAAAAEQPTLVVDFTPPPISTYCSAELSSAGCLPAIGSSGTPSASAGSGFVVSLSNALNRRPGVLWYSLAPAATPLYGGTLCVAAPVRRTGVLFAGGNLGPDDCSGTFAFDFNAWIASGADPALTAGALVHAQFLSRDPGDGADTLLLSDALRFALLP